MKAADICRAAADLVSGERARQHGDLHENHAKLAAMWNAYLAIRREPGALLTGADVALMQALVKIARTQLGAENEDNAIDIAGYAGVYGEIAAGPEEEDERPTESIRKGAELLEKLYRSMDRPVAHWDDQEALAATDMNNQKQQPRAESAHPWRDKK